MKDLTKEQEYELDTLVEYAYDALLEYFSESVEMDKFVKDFDYDNEDHANIYNEVYSEFLSRL